jgi:uncharacterized protein YgbK (DUF1537 family)
MIAVMADDLTGAAEIAGLGWRHGLRADLLARSERPSGTDLVVYDSDSRNCSPAEARRRVSRILKRIQARRPEWIYKKVDSVLRGNVIAEIEAAMAAMELKHCLLVSANPDAGRVIRRGTYYLHGTPIDRTDFRNDPHHPRLSARVADLLGRPRSAPLTILRAGTKALREGINVGEVTSFADVQHWAGLADGRTLAVGGADFFRALLFRHGHRSTGFRPGALAEFAETRRVGDQHSRRGRRTLFVSGSLAESSRKFLSACRAKGWPVFPMPRELAPVGGQSQPRRARWVRQIIEALRRHPRVVVAVGLPPLPGKRTPVRLGKILADTVKRILSATRPEVVCVEGGATAALLVEQMGWTRLKVECEFSPGVTALRPRARRNLLLVVKPGSYVWPPALAD